MREGKSDQNDGLAQRLQMLRDMEIHHNFLPEQRLLLAVLRQAYLDYYGDDPTEAQSAAEYFAHSPIYRLTLQACGLPEDVLPEGFEPEQLERHLSARIDPTDPEIVRLDVLVDRLPDKQIKIVLQMGRLSLPATAGKIAIGCQISRTAAAAALEQLYRQQLVQRHEIGTHHYWSLPSSIESMLKWHYKQDELRPWLGLKQAVSWPEFGTPE